MIVYHGSTEIIKKPGVVHSKIRQRNYMSQVVFLFHKHQGSTSQNK